MLLPSALATAALALPRTAPPPAPPPSWTAPAPRSRPALPPGWHYAAILTYDGNREVVAVPPGVEVPPIETKADPIERAKGRLAMLRIALDAYYAGALAGVNEYPRAASVDDLAVILEQAGLLPVDWGPGAPVVEFDLTAYRYRIAFEANGAILAICSPTVKNPYRMMLVLPHQL